MDKFRSKKLISLLLVLAMVAAQIIPAFAISETDERVRDAASGGARSELFNDDWKFYVSTTNANAQAVGFDDSKWADVELPHDWQIGQFGVSATNNVSTMYANGYGWYRKTFYMPPESQGKNVTIRFDGVYMDTCVYVNGTLITLNPADTARTWAYGYTAFHVDVTNYLNYGNNPNVIAVRCYYQNPNTRWYSGAGIFRNVWMITTDPVHVVHDGTYITTNGSGGDVIMDTEVVNTSAAAVSGVSVSQTLLDPNGIVVATANDSVSSIAANATATVQQTMHVNNPQLWTLDNPKLYTMKTTVTGGGSNDEYITMFGFRTILGTPYDGFLLNGERVQLKGVCMHHDLGALGSAVNYRAVERQMQILKDMGANAIRTSHNPPTPELLEICDRIGMMVITEAFDCWTSQKNTYDYARFYNNWSELDIRSWVRRERNHPCVIMWSLGNEVGAASTDNQAITRATRLQNFVRASDPRKNAFTTYGTNAPENGTFPTSDYPMQLGANVFDIFGYNYLDEHIRTNDMQRWHQRYPNLIVYGAETSSAVRSRGIYLFPDTTTIVGAPTNANYQCSSFDNNIQSSSNGTYTKTAEDAYKTTRDNAWDMGEFVWTGFDYLGEPSPYGGTSSNTNAKGSYFGIIDTAGMPKDVYYFYQSVWSDKPMLHVLPYWAPKTTISYNGQNTTGAIPVWAYTNAASVELFLNNVSQGKQMIDFVTKDTWTGAPGSWNRTNLVPLHAVWNVPYAEGVVTAVAYDASNNEIARETIQTFGGAAKVDMKADRNEITADGKDLIYIETSILDSNDVFVANATNRVEFKVSGAGTYIAADNGDSHDFEAFCAPAHKAFSGKLVAIVKSDGTEGPITITATSPGLLPQTITVNAVHKQSVASVNLTTIDGTTAINANGGKLKMVAKVLPTNADFEKVAYTAANVDGSPTDVAAVSKSGVLKALKNGVVRVTATALDGSAKSAFIDITITNQTALIPVTSITVTGASNATTITAKSRKLQMSAAVTPTDATATEVAWSVYNKSGAQIPALASIDASSGMLSPLYDGEVTVRATATDGSGVYGERDITISAQNPISLIPITSINIQLLSGSQTLSAAAGTATVKADITPLTATATVDWRVAATEDLSASSPNATISVDSVSGVVTITAKYNGTFSVVASTTNGGTGVAVQTSMPFTVTGFEEATINPYSIVKAASYTSVSSGLKYEGPEEDPLVGGIAANSWALYQNVDFGPWGSKDLILQGVNANSQGAAASIQVREGSNTGALLGTISFEKQSTSWNFDYTTQTFTPTGELLGLTGLHNICFVFTNASLTFYSWQFTETEHSTRDPYIINPVSGADSVTSTAVGFQDFDFGEPGSRKVVITGATSNNAPVTVEIRDGSATGAVLASLNFPDTSGETWGVSFKLYGSAIKRGHHLYFTFPSASGFTMQSVQFYRIRPDVVSAYQVFDATDFDGEPTVYSIGSYSDAGGVHPVLNIGGTDDSVTFNGLDFGDGGRAKLIIHGYAVAGRTFSVNNWLSNAELTQSNGYATWEYDIVGVTGIHDVSFIFVNGSDFGIDWFEFIEITVTTVEGYIDLEASMAKTTLDINEQVPVTINAVHENTQRINITAAAGTSVTVRDAAIASYAGGVLTSLAYGKTFLDISYDDGNGAILYKSIEISVGEEIDPSASAIYVNGVAIPTFSPGTYNYSVVLPGGPNAILTADLPGAGLSYTFDAPPPASLPGAATLTVTSAWGKSVTYTINLSVLPPKITAIDFGGDVIPFGDKTALDVNAPKGVSVIDFTAANVERAFPDESDVSIAFAPLSAVVSDGVPCVATITISWKDLPSLSTTYTVTFGRLTVENLIVSKNSGVITASANVSYGDGVSEYRLIYAVYKNGRLVYVSEETTPATAIDKHQSGVVSGSFAAYTESDDGDGNGDGNGNGGDDEIVQKIFLWDQNYAPLTPVCLVPEAQYYANLALNVPARASSVDSSNVSHAASSAVDGVDTPDGTNGVRWTSSAGTYPQWIEIDLGTVCDLDQISISWYVGSNNRSYQYVIYTRTEEITDWGTIVSGRFGSTAGSPTTPAGYTLAINRSSNASRGLVTDSLIGQKARYIAIRTSSSNPAGGSTAIFEITVSGSK